MSGAGTTRAAAVPPGVTLVEVGGTDVATSLAVVLSEVRAAQSATGAVLIRGFGPLEVSDFALVASRLLADVVTDNGEHEPVEPSGVVQTPVAFSADRKLLWHNENSFNRRWPRTLVFSPTVVATEGGNTPLTDSRRLLEVLDPGIVAKFRDLGVAYVRRFGQGVGVTWQRVLGAATRVDAEERAIVEGMALAWSDNDRLTTHAVRPAIIQHPLTGEPAFFAQPAHWHPAALDEETRDALVEVFGPDGLPRDCRFGDGSVIPDSMVTELLAAYASIEESFEWVAGDVLAIDNVLKAHARDPYSGPRRMLVAMGDEYEFVGSRGPKTRLRAG